MKTAVIYARYSSERQTEQSIEGQIRECTEFAKYNDITIVDTYIDRATTGTNDNRAAFQQLLKDCTKQAWDIVLVYKLDRFSRNKYEMAIHRKTLRDNGIKLVSAKENIPDSPEGIILESLLEGMAEYYSAELSQKVKRGMRESRIKGQFTGGYLLYGYKVENKKILIDENKAHIVRRIFEEYASDVFVRDIISRLTADGILNRGKPFAMNTIHHMLKNEKYVGIVRYEDEIFTDIYPQIISEKLFNIVQKKIKENCYGTHKPDIVYLLKNKARCGYCGKQIQSYTGTSQTGTICRYYACVGKKDKIKCSKTNIRKEIIESIIVDTTIKVLDNNENLNLLTDKIIAAHKKQENDTTIINILKEEQFSTQKTLDNLLSAIEKGIVTTSTKVRLEELETKIENINAKLLIEQTKNNFTLNRANVYRFLKKCIKKEPKLLIQHLINRIVLYDDKVEIYYNYTDDKRPDEASHQAFLFYKEYFSDVYNNHFNIPNFPIGLTLEMYFLFF
jgi:DNA invertase Pin-like site-specific DNA recombinase